MTRFFTWCDARGLALAQISPIAVATYLDEMHGRYRAPTIKQHLAAIRRLFDWLVTGQVMPTNPATSVRGPTHVVRTGKTPVLQPAEARLLLDTIDTSTLRGLRDRALLAVMVYSFARVSAVVGMRVEDYYQQGKRMAGGTRGWSTPGCTPGSIPRRRRLQTRRCPISSESVRKSVRSLLSTKGGASPPRSLAPREVRSAIASRSVREELPGMRPAVAMENGQR